MTHHLGRSSYCQTGQPAAFPASRADRQALARRVGAWRCIVVVALWLALAGGVDSAAGEVDPQSLPEAQGFVKAQLGGVDEKIGVVRTDDGRCYFLLQQHDGRTVALEPAEFAQRLYFEQSQRPWYMILLNITSVWGVLWVTIGLGGQVLFTGRMIVQWLVSERSRRSVVPVAFWWMSLTGATMLLVYFAWRKDIVGILGQSTGWFIYVRNLWLIYRPNHKPVPASQDAGPEPALARQSG